LEVDLKHRNDDLQAAMGELRETQQKLIHSEKLNALGQLSAGLLHEVNNPLNYALTALDIAKNDPAITGDEDLSEMLGDIDEGMQRIRRIVGELRTFAYPSKGDHQPFDLAEAVDGAVQITAHEAKDFSIRNEVPPQTMALGSRNHISQVLINLLTNAAKALREVSGERDGEIRISAVQHDGRWQVRVRDNGPGIPEETLSRIFDPFYTTRDVGEGMGMGLSVCQTIIRNHGGELEVASEVGSWTEFAFDLPVAEASAESRNGAGKRESERTA
jgi:C4-dicarboxylate-specific signal transduction histidine kinase